MENGKLIQDFVMELSGEEPVLYKAADGGSIKYEEQNLGDHGIAWAVRYDADGREIDRYNMKYVACITWVK